MVEIVKTGENQPRFYPDIVYKGNLNKESSPYSLHIDVPLLADLMREGFSFSDEQIVKTKIAFIGIGGRDYHGPLEYFHTDLFSNILVLPGGVSTFPDNKGKQRVVIFPDNILADLEAARVKIVNISRNAKNDGISAKKEKRTSKELSEYFNTNRLVDYSKRAGPDRVTRFVDKIFPVVAKRLILYNLGYELSILASRRGTSRVSLFTREAAAITLGLGPGFTAKIFLELVGEEQISGGVSMAITAISYYMFRRQLDYEDSNGRLAMDFATDSKWGKIVSFKLNRPLGPPIDL